MSGLFEDSEAAKGSANGDIDFMMEIARLEKADKLRRHMSKDLSPLLIELGKAKVQAVPAYQWLAGCSIKERFQGEDKFIQLIPPEGKEKLIDHFINWCEQSGIGPLGMRAFNVKGIYIFKPAKRGGSWTYPKNNKGIIADGRAVDAVVDKLALSRMMDLG